MFTSRLVGTQVTDEEILNCHRSSEMKSSATSSGVQFPMVLERLVVNTKIRESCRCSLDWDLSTESTRSGENLSFECREHDEQTAPDRPASSDAALQ